MQLERLAPRHEEGLAAGVAVRPLGDRDQRHVGDAERGERLPRGGELALARRRSARDRARASRLVIARSRSSSRTARPAPLPSPLAGEGAERSDGRVRGLVRVGEETPHPARPSVARHPLPQGERVTEPRLARRINRRRHLPAAPRSSSRLKRRVSTSRIMPKSSPGVSSAERMLNLRYWFFRKPSGPATIMAPTAFAALDVAVVVDLDAPRRARQPEALRQRRQQLALRGGVGELAAERLARIGERVIDQLLLLAALRQQHLDLVAALGRERLAPAARGPRSRARAGCSRGHGLSS